VRVVFLCKWKQLHFFLTRGNFNFSERVKNTHLARSTFFFQKLAKKSSLVATFFDNNNNNNNKNTS